MRVLKSPREKQVGGGEDRGLLGGERAKKLKFRGPIGRKARAG